MYLHLSFISRKFFSIFGSSLSTEILFSKTGYISSESRFNCFKPKHVENLVFHQENHKLVKIFK